MALRLSRDEGGFTVLLEKIEWLDPALIAHELARALKLPRSDTVRACRLQRGILFLGATREQADAALGVLGDFNVAALVVPDSELPLMPKPVEVSLSVMQKDGLVTSSLSGAGLPPVWKWEDLALAVGGILVDAKAQTAGLFDKVEEAGVAEAEDRQSMAARQLEKARDRVFPLKNEIAKAGGVMGEALEAALAGKSGAINREVEGFGKIDTALDLFFLKPFERLRVTGHGRVTGIEYSPSKARNLHVIAKELAERALDATLPGATIALAEGVDSGKYVFEDLSQFDSYCRWAYFWRLRRQAENAANREEE